MSSVCKNCVRLADHLSKAEVERDINARLLDTASEQVGRMALALSEEQRLLELAKLALRKIGEFDKYEPAGPAAAAARSTLSVLEAK